MKAYEMSRAQLEEEIARRQKRLIPLNIVVVIISLIAAFTIFFAPLITVDLSKSGPLMDEMASQSGQAGEETTDNMLAVLEDSGIKIDVTTSWLLGTAFSEDPSAEIISMAADIVRENEDALITEVALPMLVDSLKEEGNDIPEIKDPQAILNKIRALESAQPSQVDEAIDDALLEVQSQLGKDFLPDESLDEAAQKVREIYDDTVQNNDGAFTLEACVCVTFSTMNSEEGQSGEIYTSYDELIDGMLSEQGEDFANTIDQAAPYLKIVAGAMIFFAAVWVILALFALLRIFTKNKRFTMWYVKLFGCYPCILFWLAPLLANTLAPAVAAEAAGTVTAALAMISSTAWISGLCYLLLWAISIFWAFPIKRGIRKCKKQLKTVGA